MLVDDKQHAEVSLELGNLSNFYLSWIVKNVKPLLKYFSIFGDGNYTMFIR